MEIYIQYHSPTRGSQKPILFDRVESAEEAVSMLAKAKAEFINNTTAFVGKHCSHCKSVFPADELNRGYCAGCLRDMAEADREEPNGGAYREHQYT